MLCFPVAAPTTPGFVEGVCPSNEWKEFGAYCYYFSESDTASFDNAEIACDTKAGYWKGNLASVHNKVTNQWLYDTYKEDTFNDGVWIGLERDLSRANEYQGKNGIRICL